MKVVRQEELGQDNSQQFNMMPLVEVTQLPSGFIAYPEGVKISYRPYVFGEIKKFNQSNMSKLNAYELAMQGVVVEGMPKDDITFADMLYIALLRKISSLGDTSFSVSFKCGKCGKTNTVSVEHKKVSFVDMEVKKLPIEVTLSNDKLITFGLFTYGNYKELTKLNRMNDDMYAMALTAKNMSAQEAYETMYNAPVEDGALFDYVDRLQYHNIAPMEFTCKEEGCGHKTRVRLTGGDVLIGPFRKSDEYVKSRVRFGV